MTSAARVAFVCFACVVTLAGCGGGETQDDYDAEDVLSTQQVQDSAALADAAGAVVAFLRGDGPFDPARYADTVTLHIAPEGGGAARRVAREQLADPAGWSVGDISFTPPADLTNLTLQPGTHFSCFETPLATRSEELARLPHAGARLERTEGGSCLQTWNLTLIFASDVSPPVLVAALYDQWEW